MALPSTQPPRSHSVSPAPRQVKTHKELQTDQDTQSFYRHKALKVFIQSFLVGVPHVLVGHRAPDGTVATARTFRTTDLCKGAKEYWHYGQCFDFCSHLLHWLKAQTEHNVRYAVRFRPPFTHVSLERSQEPFPFLPPELLLQMLVDVPPSPAPT